MIETTGLMLLIFGGCGLVFAAMDLVGRIVDVVRSVRRETKGGKI